MTTERARLPEQTEFACANSKPSSSPAKAGDPVTRGRSRYHILRHGVLDAPPARGMTTQRTQEGNKFGLQTSPSGGRQLRTGTGRLFGEQEVKGSYPPSYTSKTNNLRIITQLSASQKFNLGRLWEAVRRTPALIMDRASEAGPQTCFKPGCRGRAPGHCHPRRLWGKRPRGLVWARCDRRNARETRVGGREHRYLSGRRPTRPYPLPRLPTY
jgi:hypothetical protein